MKHTFTLENLRSVTQNVSSFEIWSRGCQSPTIRKNRWNSSQQSETNNIFFIFRAAEIVSTQQYTRRQTIIEWCQVVAEIRRRRFSKMQTRMELYRSSMCWSICNRTNVKKLITGVKADPRKTVRKIFDYLRKIAATTYKLAKGKICCQAMIVCR